MTTHRFHTGRSRRRTHGFGIARAQRGVGLIEVLVAVLLLSIAFLGVAALQAKSLSTNNSAMARSMATMASYSILDAMRADYDLAASGGYNTSSPIKASACPAADTTVKNAQLNDWCVQLGKSLGASDSTTGSIACTGTRGDCTITITFDDSRAGKGGASNQTVVTRGML
ncbi:type IV pilus modification protein PilV [Dyella japonica]|jgi:type IV pilus assembly protein PilV|uniref:type IV pilus modification protein PilV n=1 Tax=Dyella japonica TaxID=231455 RepID=UPI0009E5ACBD|nr:type IV pilus modification protein PilV [Dyella japonica]